MNKRKLLLSSLFLAAALSIFVPSVRADGGQGGGEDKERPRWPPIRPTASEVHEPQESDQGYSVQGLWEYLVSLLKTVQIKVERNQPLGMRHRALSRCSLIRAKGLPSR